MNRRRTTRSLPPESSDEDEPLAKKAAKIKEKSTNHDESSSESDIENYLQPADKIDLNSSFFNLQNDVQPSFDKIENDIFAGITRLNDSSSDDEAFEKPEKSQEPSTSKLNFKQLHDYTKKMEETRKHVEEYKAKKQTEIQQMDILNLLAAGESKISEDKQAVLANLEASLHSSDFDSCSDSDKEEWEEVKEIQKEKNKVPKEGLQITVELPGVIKKKKGVDLLAAIKRRFNRIKKENQVLIHKVHLLCWIAHGNYVNSIINSPNILATALSLLPSQHCYPADRTDLNYLEQIVKWYKNAVIINEKVIPKNKTLDSLLETQITKKEAYNKNMLVLIFVAILRSLGIQCRLVLSFQLLPLRPPSSELYSVSTKADDEKASTSKNQAKKTEKEQNKNNETAKSKNEEKMVKKSKTSEPKCKKPQTKTVSDVPRSKIEENKKSRPLSTGDIKEKFEIDKKSRLKPENKTSKPKVLENEEKRPKSTSSVKETQKSKTGKSHTKSESDGKSEKKHNLRSKKNSLAVPQLDGANDSDSDNFLPQIDGANDDNEGSSKPNLKKLKQTQETCPLKTHPKRLKTKNIKYKDSDSDDDFTTRSPFSDKNKESPVTNGVNLKKLKSLPKTNQPGGNQKKKVLDVRNDIIQLVKGTIKEQKQIDRSKTVKKRKSLKDDESDSDYAPEVIKKKPRESDDDFAPKIKVKQRVQVKKVTSSDSEDGKIKKKGVDAWVEVFLETEEKWISVDVVKGQLHCVNELYTRTTHPVSYIVAWNNDNTIKDITRRYCQNFNTVTRKLRVDAKWWEATLKPFSGRKTARDKEEDEDLERQQLDKPLPTSIVEYKNHPLYVLKRHLLKFEAIYPPDAPTLGFVRKEPVYSRQCVYTLHSRDIWLKHAKVVKPGEKPYKIVKARPKWDKLSQKVINDQMLEIFGPWQVEDYVPPVAENGIVPRNAFGNVELFKPCMLPKKTVHLKLPGLNKIAKRMDIDCASAIVGFDFHGGWSHPTYDGFVVCEEYADVLVAAWELEQEEMEKKEQEKVEKRVYTNWKKLIKGLLIRERLKAKYEFGEPSGSGGGKGKKKAKGGPKSTTKKGKVEDAGESD